MCKERWRVFFEIVFYFEYTVIHYGLIVKQLNGHWPQFNCLANRNCRPMNWNRDFNGSLGILSKGLRIVAGRTVPKNYFITAPRVVQVFKFHSI